MKALTLTQPWASLIGAKMIETRSWDTKYRGPVAIHAAAGFPGWAKAICATQPFKRILSWLGYDHWSQLPLGKIVAVCDLVDVQATGGFWDWEPEQGSNEWAFGDYSPGRFMWRLENVRRLPEPVPAKGALGLWAWETDASLL